MATVTASVFGELHGRAVERLTLRNHAGMCAELLTYGAALRALRVPDSSGALRDVVLGYDDVPGYVGGSCFFGATIGRSANRIAGARFTLDGREQLLSQNEGENQLHGGIEGFDRKLWSYVVENGSVTFSRVSPDGEEGYPGSLEVRVCYRLREDSALVIDYSAVCDRDTVVNLTNHSYFNLNGGGSALGHELRINAERVTENGDGGIPTGAYIPVGGTAFDFRTPRVIADALAQGHENLVKYRGFDHNFALSGGGFREAAALQGDESGITLRVFTDTPGLQLYCANYVEDVRGKGGAVHEPGCAVCLETQYFPNSVNQPGFKPPFLRAGEVYRSTTEYRFE